MDDIRVQQLGDELDRDLKAINSVLEADAGDNGKILYIRGGELALEDGDALFDIIPL